MPPASFWRSGLFHDVPATFWFAFTFYASICVLALWKGERDERLAGGVLIVAAFASAVFRDRQWAGVQWGLFASDVPTFAVMLWIAMKSRKWWPMFTAAFLLLAILTHAASMVDRTLGEWAYITAG